MANVLTQSGRTVTVNRLNGTGTAPTFIGWGTGAGSSATTDTILFTEDSGGSPAYARVNGTPAIVTTNSPNDTYQVQGTLTANASKTITNVGLFDALTAGNLVAKGDFTGVALNNGDSIKFTVNISYQ